MKKVSLFTIILLFGAQAAFAGDATAPNRPQRYAAYRAHKILPQSLRLLVRKHAKQLFAGLRKGTIVPPGKINRSRIMAETQRITQMVDNHRPFKDVVFQMGFVSGLVSVYTNPALDADRRVQKGFQYYLNMKLDRCLFVFDGHSNLVEKRSILAQQAWLVAQLDQQPQLRGQFRKLLETRYAEVKHNWRYRFDERSAVFGVSSIYFSNTAGLTAHLWYYAWASANGDLSKTPYSGIRKAPHLTAP